MEIYPQVLGVLMKNMTSFRRNSLSLAMEMLVDLLRNHINIASYKETCESLCEGIKMIHDKNRIFSDLMELPSLNEVTPHNINIKVLLIKTAQRILKEHSSSSLVGEVGLTPSSKRKAVVVMDKILSSSKSARLSREANQLKSELLSSAID
jgi:hypothetical protein